MSDVPELSRSTVSREYTPMKALPPHGSGSRQTADHVGARTSPFARPGQARVQSSSSFSGFSNLDDGSIRHGETDVQIPPQRPEAARRSQSHDLRSGVASPVMPDVPPDDDNPYPISYTDIDRRDTPSSTEWIELDLLTHLANPRYNDRPSTELRAGLVQKPFFIDTELLTRTCPFFNMLSHPIPTKLSGPFYFPDLDEYAFALFVRWIYGGKLHGPHDFHSMQHYLCLYVLGARFEIEALRNNVMDLVRAYYRRESMTAPAFRIDYIYANTDGSCPMREFLITSAAYRAMSEGERGGISESVKGALKGGGQVAVDFAEAMVKLANNERVDVRRGDDCRWHDHEVTEKCPKGSAPEPYEKV